MGRRPPVMTFSTASRPTCGRPLRAARSQRSLKAQRKHETYNRLISASIGCYVRLLFQEGLCRSQDLLCQLSQH
jgi:hypothetical protein